jgi:hypothetical protein
MSSFSSRRGIGFVKKLQWPRPAAGAQPNCFALENLNQAHYIEQIWVPSAMEKINIKDSETRNDSRL